MKYVHVYFLLEPGMNALNNAGKETDNHGNENRTAVKKYFYKKKPYPYFSGQAYRRWLRDTLTELTGKDYSTIVDDLEREEFVKGTHYDEKGKTIILKKKLFEDYPGADVFGYMVTKKKSESIVRQSPTLNSFILGVLDRNFIYDVVTKRSEDLQTKKQKSTSFSHREVAYNVYYGTMTLEVDRYGAITPSELTADQETRRTINPIDFGDEYRIEQVKNVLKAFFNLRGGANLARILANVSPRYAVIAVTENGNNIFPSMRPIVKDTYVQVPKSFIDAARTYYGDNVFVYSFDWGQESLVQEDVPGDPNWKTVVDEVVNALKG